MSESCLTCRYFVQHRRVDREVGGEVNLTTGDCRRWPPRAAVLAVWPMVNKADFCGEWGARPE